MTIGRRAAMLRSAQAFVALYTTLRSADSDAAGERPKALVTDKIFFIPFDVDTYIPVTPTTIEQGAFLKILFLRRDMNDLHPLLREFRGMLRTPATTVLVNDNYIRLKVTLESNVYLVDRTGAVREAATGKTFTIAPPDLKRLADSVGVFEGVIDVNAVERSADTFRKHAR